MSGLAGPADLVPDLFLAGLDRGHGAIMAGLWRVYQERHRPDISLTIFLARSNLTGNTKSFGMSERTVPGQLSTHV